jgi:DNA-binding NarL/FixJ family response regulator
MSIRVMLVDDHPIVREGVRRQLEAISHFRVVGEAANSDEALCVAREHKPDIALIDIGLPGTDGIELMRLLLQQNPAMAVLILSMYDDEEYVGRAVRAGARGYVLKDSGARQIVAAVEAIAAGGTYYTSTVVGAIRRGSTHSPLSPREREILTYLVEGRSNKEIAKQLKLSVRTIETHRETIRRKLGAERIVDLIRQAVRYGLVKM